MSSVVNQGEWSTLLFRVLLAIAAGAAIGFDRQLRGKPAGLRTHILVSIGACLFVLVPLVLDGTTDAVARVIQGVAAGIGFLGAGEILRVPSTEPSKARVHGLTSAAAIWVAAGLGAVAGCGLWRLSIIGCGGTLLALTVVRTLEHTLRRRKRKRRNAEDPQRSPHQPPWPGSVMEQEE